MEFKQHQREIEQDFMTIVGEVYLDPDKLPLSAGDVEEALPDELAHVVNIPPHRFQVHIKDTSGVHGMLLLTELKVFPTTVGEMSMLRKLGLTSTRLYEQIR